MDEKWFKQQQRRVGVTAKEIADIRGMSRANVSHILNGRQAMSLEWAKAFAEVLQVPLATILEKAGVAERTLTEQLQPGYAGSDATPFIHNPTAPDAAKQRLVAQAFGQKAGVDVWQVRSRAMALAGFLEGDFLLVDTYAAERVRSGDVVIAQVQTPSGASTILRRYEPPVLVAASTDPADGRVFVVDSLNVVLKGKIIASWRA